MAKQPAILIYTGDWFKDTRLAMCAAATRGIWFDALCRMHESGTGSLSGTPDQLARVLRCSLPEVQAAIVEIKATNVGDVRENDGVVTIISRRLTREAKERKDCASRVAAFRERGGGDPERWTAIRAQILIRDRKTCAYCGRRATTVDHIQPRSRNGPHTPQNLVACCKKCNLTKADRTPAEAGMTFWPAFDQSKLRESNSGSDEVVKASSIASTSSIAVSKSPPQSPSGGGRREREFSEALEKFK